MTATLKVMGFAISLLAWLGCPLPASAGPADSARLTIMVPAYIYPDQKGVDQWNQIISASSRVPVAAIVNADSGPGKAPIPEYTALLKRAAASRLCLIAYVSTSYAQRPLEAVKKDIDQWRAFYPGLRGVFLDEQASGPEHVAYYSELSRHAQRECGWELAVSNPGTGCDEAYFSRQAADVVCLYESAKAIGSVKFPGWIAKYPHPKAMLLAYGVKTAEEMQQWVNLAVKRGIRYLYITDAKGNDPWNRLPTYWDREVEAVQKANAR